MLISLTLMLHKLVQKVKTNVVKKNCNPEWCDEVSLSIKDLNDPIELVSNISDSAICMHVYT